MSPTGVLLRSPDLATASDRRFITGLNLPRFDSAALAHPFFLGSDDLAGSLGHPSGDFEFLFPQIAVDANDRVHLVWAEAAEPLVTADDPSFPVLTELWHATYSDGAWSFPVKVFEAGRLYWTRERSAMFLDPRDGVLNIIFDTFPRGDTDTDTGPTVLVRVADRAPLTVDTIFQIAAPIYMGATGRGASIELAYVDWHRPSGGARVLVVSSSDFGKTWSEPVVLNSETQGKPTDTWAFLGVANDLHVLWIETAGDLLFGSSSLHHARRPSGSQRWEVDDAFPLPPGLGHSDAAMDRCGGLHLVADLVDDTGMPTVAYFEKGRFGWARAEVPVGGVGSTEPAIEADNSGLYLTWSEIRDGSGGEQAGVRVMLAGRPIR